MSVYWLGLIPFLLWFASILFQNDRMCSRVTENLFLLASVLCFALGSVLHHYEAFPEKPGFFVVAFGTPLLFVGISEICRLIYVRIRGEVPCINVRSGRWIGDPPMNGHWTKFPPGKKISWADIVFGLTQWVVPIVITMVLFIWSLAANG
jgi:hypothetical protein